GERVVVEADVFAEGHDELACVLLHRHGGERTWTEVPMRALVNDRWQGEFRVCALGRHFYTLQAWVDHFHTWARDLVRRIDAGQDVSVELLIGAALVRDAAERTEGPDGEALLAAARTMTGAGGERAAISARLAELMARHPDRTRATRYERELEVLVDRE